MFKVGDRVYFDEGGAKIAGTVTKIDDTWTKLPAKTIWAIWDYDGSKGWVSSEDLFLEECKPDGWSSDYYKLPENPKELQDLIEYRNMNFAIGNVFKACWRLGEKPGVDELYDLNKMRWFVEREIERVKKNVQT